MILPINVWSENQRLRTILDRLVKQTRPLVKEQVKSLSDLERRDELDNIKVRLENAKVLENMLRERFQEQLRVLEKSGDKAWSWNSTFRTVAGGKGI